VSALDQFNFLANPSETSFDIRKFLQFCLVPAHKIKDVVKTRLTYQYSENLDELTTHLKRVDEAFDMIKRLDEIHGIKGILPCVFNSLNRMQKQPVTKHALLTFSGFLSQNDKPEESWGHLNELIEPHGMQVYDLKWQSIQYSDIAKSVTMKLGQLIALEVAGLFIPGEKMVKAARLAYYMLRSTNYIYNGIALQVKDLFKLAIKNARLTGKLVALSLVLGYPFST
jgi:hypothetical protein